MKIIEDAKGKFVDKPISLFEQAKKNYNIHQKMKNAKKHINIINNRQNPKRDRFGSVNISQFKIFNLKNKQNSLKRNNRNIFPNSITNENNIPVISKSTNNLSHFTISINKFSKTVNDDYLKIIHEKKINNNNNNNNNNNSNDNNNNSNHFNDSSFLNESENNKIKMELDKNNKKDNITQTFNITKLDKVHVLFNKSHNQRIINNYGIKDNKDYSTFTFRKIKPKKKDKIVLRYNNTNINKRSKRFRIDFEDSYEKKRKTETFLNKIKKLQNYINNKSLIKTNNNSRNKYNI